MRLWISGSTGFSGRELVRLARAQGHEVFAHVRPLLKGGERRADWPQALQDWGAQVVECPWQKDRLLEAMAIAKPTHVFSLIGTTRKRACKEGLDPARAYQKIDRDLTLMLLEVTKQCAPQAVFVYLSSLGADAKRRNAYLEARHDCEAAIRTSGISHIIVRPSFISGPDRDDFRLGERFAVTLSDRFLAMLKLLGIQSPYQRYRSISNTELAHGLLRTAMDPLWLNRVIERKAL